ncbi:hypothetical protein BZA05DRAFT_442261 [Tricharina praecox]|uniref:uncharacterized protein n=1 Tax=Tricharina praecox TaxID=43433 RepID=UPI00221FC46F|nr:uncharacterized protein BZA05DRAFT_442261 [Tricharina praecox]KAI5856582.1 hypothetical protein BZA05DRAFT_442261 [Tricharina praecox]
MQSLHTLLLLISAVALTLGAPSARPRGTILPNECTSGCAAAVSCLASFPESCLCWNAAIARCAKQCKQKPAPTPENCRVKPAPPPTTPPKDCFAECQGGQACVLIWPQSCYCQNGINQRCAEMCGVKGPPAQECPPLEEPAVV